MPQIVAEQLGLYTTFPTFCILRAREGNGLQRICVFCGSNSGARKVYAEAAAGLGRLLAARGLGLVYGGGSVGLMGVIADAALAAGGEVIGVIPHELVRREVGHTGLSDLRVVDSMHERKALMADLADAFLALPGGIGTLDEWFEIWTWAQLGLHGKPCGMLNVEGFYDPLLAFVERMVAERFLREDYRDLILVDTDPVRLLEALASRARPSL